MSARNYLVAVPDGLATFAAFADFALAMKVSILISLNGWNATHTIPFGIAAALVVGAIGAAAVGRSPGEARWWQVGWWRAK